MNAKIILLGIFLMTHLTAFANEKHLSTPRDRSVEPILLEKTISGRPDEAWKLWTDPQKLTTWLAVDAHVDLKRDGLYELFWEPEHPEQNSTIGCKIIDLEPNKVLSFQWKGPVPFAVIMNVEPLPTWVRVTFLAVSKNQTTIRLEHFGWKSDSHWSEAKKWQESAWQQAFSQLR